ncbi:hypothetical protein QVD17_19855 [Tagetes erecta]|uniref:Uncharacterized protein n=1 Tax=Tagetes erecta TaxID=13708 RepID=A0AAD8KRP2_TARER|nr:hypothetical protein QVD17_19855 [Tagetes erecta]
MFVRRSAWKVGHGKSTEEREAKEGASFSGSSDGSSGPGVNQTNPIQVDDLDDFNLLAGLMGLSSSVKESSTSRVIEMDPLEEVSGATVKSPVGVLKSKVVSKGKGKAPEVRHGDVLKKPSTCREILRNIAPETKRAYNAALEDEKLMSNVIVHTARLASSLPDVIDRYKAIHAEYSDVVAAEVIADTEIRSLTSDRDDLREKQREMFKRIGVLESWCKATDKKVGEIVKERDALTAKVKELKAEKVAGRRSLRRSRS